MQSTRIGCSALILFTLACFGCGPGVDNSQRGESAAATGEAPTLIAESALAQPASAPPSSFHSTPTSQQASKRGGPAQRSTVSTASAAERIEPRAARVFAALVKAYQAADQYSDRGFVELAYRRNGRDYQDRAPLRVQFHRRRALMLHAYATHLAIDRGRLLATIEEARSENFDNQILDVELARTPFALADIYGDPAVSHFASAGLGGPSPQLELLLSTDPLAGLMGGEASLTLAASAELEGQRCDILAVSADGLRYRFWVDRQQRLLRRVELPPESAGLATDPSVEQVRLRIELEDASFAAEAPDRWLLPERPLGRRVTQFVPPPPPLATPLLGKRVAEFELRPLGEDFVVGPQGSDRDFTVMLWIADHAASRLAVRELQRIADDTAPALAERTRFLAVMAEPVADDPQHSVRLLRSWNVGLPVADDRSAAGRDVFGIAEAPTLVVLSGEGVVEWFQPRVGPEMANGLPALLTDLGRGVEVGQTLRDQHRADRETYRQMLEEVRSRPTETLPPR